MLRPNVKKESRVKGLLKLHSHREAGMVNTVVVK